jgi:hypothetical protein
MSSKSQKRFEKNANISRILASTRKSAHITFKNTAACVSLSVYSVVKKPGPAGGLQISDWALFPDQKEPCPT